MTAPCGRGALAASMSDSAHLSASPRADAGQDKPSRDTIIPNPASQVASSATPGPIGVCLRLVLAGPPGAGKTTHGNRLAAAYCIPEISMGNLLRNEVQQGTDLGKQAKPYMDRGDLVPLDIVSQVLEKRLIQPDAAHGFILDGLPRRIDDAHLLDRMTQKMGIAPIPMLLLDVPDREIVARVENRRVCDNGHMWDLKTHPPRHDGVCDEDGLPLKRRKDDDPAVVQHRLEIFHQETEPVLQYYRERGLLHTVDGSGSIEEVGARVTRTAASLTTDR